MKRVLIIGGAGSIGSHLLQHARSLDRNGAAAGPQDLGYEVDHMGVNTEPEYREIKRSDKIERDHYQLGVRLRPRVTQQVD